MKWRRFEREQRQHGLQARRFRRRSRAPSISSSSRYHAEVAGDVRGASRTMALTVQLLVTQLEDGSTSEYAMRKASSDATAGIQSVA